MAYQLLSNSPVTGKISWVGVRLVYDGADHAIANGSTDKRFVYWLASAPTVFQVSDTLPALGPDDTIVFLNKNGIAINVLNATALEGDLVVPGTVTSQAIAANAISADHVQSNAIVGRHILAGEITAAHITVESLQAISANMGSITSGNLTIDQAGFIRGGQTSYRVGTGFWLGYHQNTYKLSYKGSSGVEFLFDGNGIGVYDKFGNPILTATGVPYTAVTDAPTSLEQINALQGQKLSSVQAGATRNVSRGDWAENQTYQVGDFVLYGGSSWLCDAGHSSTQGNKPPTLPTTFNAYWSLYAAKGTDAAPAVTYWINKSDTVISKRDTGEITPGLVTFTAKSKSGDAEAVDYSGRFEILATFDGTNYASIYTSTANEASASYSVTSPNLKGLKVRLYQAGGTTSLLDEETVPVVADAVSYDVKIESTNGDTFRVGQSTTTILKARVFRNGVDITDALAESRFQWKRVSAIPQEPPNDDATWNSLYASGYKQIQINVDSVYARATFHCYIVD